VAGAGDGARRPHGAPSQPRPISDRGATTLRAGLSLGLERLVHRYEPAPRGCTEPAPEHRNQDPTERFPVMQPRPIRPEWLDSELLLASEHPAREERPAPRERAGRTHTRHARIERRRPCSRAGGPAVEPGRLAYLTPDITHQGVPARMPLEVDEHGPHPPGRGIDVDLRLDVHGARPGAHPTRRGRAAARTGTTQGMRGRK